MRIVFIWSYAGEILAGCSQPSTGKSREKILWPLVYCALTDCTSGKDQTNNAAIINFLPISYVRYSFPILYPQEVKVSARSKNMLEVQSKCNGSKGVKE